jgi:hypothetical protein
MGMSKSADSRGRILPNESRENAVINLPIAGSPQVNFS